MKCSFKSYYILMPSIFIYDPTFVPLHIFMWSQWKYSVCLFLPILVSAFTFTGKSACEIIFTHKTELSLSVTSIIITIKITLWRYVTNFVVCQSACHFFCISDERYTFCIIIVLWNLHLILGFSSDISSSYFLCKSGACYIVGEWGKVQNKIK